MTLTAVARMESPDGAKTTTTQTVKVRKAGLTNAYDGYYKGTGGLVIRVSGGYLTSISVGLNAYCQRDAKFMHAQPVHAGRLPADDRPRRQLQGQRLAVARHRAATRAS